MIQKISLKCIQVEVGYQMQPQKEFDPIDMVCVIIYSKKNRTMNCRHESLIGRNIYDNNIHIEYVILNTK